MMTMDDAISFIGLAIIASAFVSVCIFGIGILRLEKKEMDDER